MLRWILDPYFRPQIKGIWESTRVFEPDGMSHRKPFRSKLEESSDISLLFILQCNPANCIAGQRVLYHAISRHVLSNHSLAQTSPGTSAVTFTLVRTSLSTPHNSLEVRDPRTSKNRADTHLFSDQLHTLPRQFSWTHLLQTAERDQRGARRPLEHVDGLHGSSVLVVYLCAFSCARWFWDRGPQ